MVKILKYLYHRTWLYYPGKALINLYDFLKNTILPDQLHQEMHFKNMHGYRIDLNNPKTLNEKIVWLKLFHRTPLHTQCADKFAVREYVLDKIGEEYLVPLYYETLNPKDITPKNLPDAPMIVKTNHDSGGGIFIYDKEGVEWYSVRKILKKRMSKNYYRNSKEWQYKNIKPRIIVEKLLLDNNGNIPFDYKLHCFNGKVRMIQVDAERGTPNHFRNWYSRDWKREPYKWSANKGKGVFTDPSDEEVQKPKSLQDMISLSEILSKPFPYVRVDWYDVDGQLYFGELTFHHDGGMRPILPHSWDERLGAEVDLSVVSH